MRTKLLVGGGMVVLALIIAGGTFVWKDRFLVGPAAEAVAADGGKVFILHERMKPTARGAGIDRLIAVDARTGERRAKAEHPGTLVAANGNVYVFDDKTLATIDPASLAFKPIDAVQGTDLCFQEEKRSIWFRRSDGRSVVFDLASARITPTTDACASGRGWTSTSSSMLPTGGTVELQPIAGSNRYTLSAGGRAIASELESPTVVAREGVALAPARDTVLVVHKKAGASVLSLVAVGAGKITWEAPLPFSNFSSVVATSDTLLVLGEGHARALDIATGRLLFERSP